MSSLAQRRLGLRVAAGLVAAMGLAGTRMLAPAPGSLPSRVLDSFDIHGVPWSATTRAMLGILLVVVARGLLRQRRAAFVLAAAYAAVAWGANLLDTGASVATCCTGAALVLLVRSRDGFVGLVGPARRRVVTGTAAVVLAGALLYGAGGVALHRSELRPPPDRGLTVREVTARLVGAPGPLVADGRGGRAFVHSLPPLGGTGLVVVLLLLLAPLTDDPVPEGTREQVAGLVERSENDTLAPFALRSDKSYALAPDGRAAVGYRTILGVCLASGDPVGEVASAADAFAAYLDRCARRGWLPAVVGAGEETAALARSFGLRALYFGDEAVVDVASFGLGTPSLRNVRQAVQRTHNFGVTTRVLREGDADAVLRDQLARIAREWRNGVPERGFSMILDQLLTGGFPSSVLVVCRDATGRPIAFQRYLPCRGGRALTLDTMRRERTAPNGVNERMIVEAIEWARARGVDEISLNFAGFRTIFETEHDLLGRLERWAAHRLDPFIRVEALYRFNAKFRPGWRPRYVLFRSFVDIGWILPAALAAEFALPLDRRGRRAARAVGSPEPAGQATMGG